MKRHKRKPSPDNTDDTRLQDEIQQWSQDHCHAYDSSASSIDGNVSWETLQLRMWTAVQSQLTQNERLWPNLLVDCIVKDYLGWTKTMQVADSFLMDFQDDSISPALLLAESDDRYKRELGSCHVDYYPKMYEGRCLYWDHRGESGSGSMTPLLILNVLGIEGAINVHRGNSPAFTFVVIAIQPHLVYDTTTRTWQLAGDRLPPSRAHCAPTSRLANPLRCDCVDDPAAKITETSSTRSSSVALRTYQTHLYRLPFCPEIPWRITLPLLGHDDGHTYDHLVVKDLQNRQICPVVFDDQVDLSILWYMDAPLPPTSAGCKMWDQLPWVCPGFFCVGQY